MKINLNLDKRQKIIILLILLSLIVLCWQIYSFVGGNANENSINEISQSNVAKVKTQLHPKLIKQMPSGNVRETFPHETIANKTLPLPATVGESTNDVVQQKYLALVNQYQIVEVERMIAQDEAAIAQSRAAAAEALAKIGETAGSNMTSATTMNYSTHSGDYELIYTGEDNHQWTATLKKAGQFNDVTSGSVLPDGSKILSVSDNGVVIDQNGNKKLITFNGVVPFNPSPNKQSVQHLVPLNQDENDSSEGEDSDNSAVSVPQKTASTSAVVPEKVSPISVREAPKSALLKPTVLNQKLDVSSDHLQKNSQITQQHSQNVMSKNVTKSPNIVPKPAPSVDITKVDKNAYTIQIVSGDDLKVIHQLITNNQLTDKAQVIKIRRLVSGHSLYIAVYGVYPDMQSAMKAINRLPDDVKDEGPFVKKISDIQFSQSKTEKTS